MSVDRRREIVVSGHADLSVARQCELLCISRSGFYYEPAGESAEALALMQVIDEAFLKFPFYGSRQMARHLVRQGHAVESKRVLGGSAAGGSVD